MAQAMAEEKKTYTYDDDEFDAIVDGIVYNGLNLNAIRQKLADDDNRDGVIDLVMRGLIAYMRCGNNAEKLVKKVKNPKVGRDLIQNLKGLGIKKKTKDSADLSLPRLALAFLPALYLLRFRYEIQNKLQNQTSSSLAVRYKDLAFAGIPTFSENKDYLTFYDEFSALINKSKEEEKEEEEEDEGILGPAKPKKRKTDVAVAKAKKIHRPWMDVAKNGYVSDVKIHAIMDFALAVKKGEEIKINNIAEVVDKILDQYTKA
jgi:hypothetical protein